MITSHSVQMTIDAGIELASALRGGEVIALAGDLGAGKTHFVKGIALGIGYLGDVTSPTFGLVHEYRGGRCDCIHFDFYRLEERVELEGIGFPEFLCEAEAICVIEWPERFPEALPETAIWVRIEVVNEETRYITIR